MEAPSFISNRLIMSKLIELFGLKSRENIHINLGFFKTFNIILIDSILSNWVKKANFQLPITKCQLLLNVAINIVHKLN